MIYFFSPLFAFYAPGLLDLAAAVAVNLYIFVFMLMFIRGVKFTSYILISFWYGFYWGLPIHHTQPIRGVYFSSTSIPYCCFL